MNRPTIVSFAAASITASAIGYFVIAGNAAVGSDGPPPGHPEYNTTAGADQVSRMDNR